MKRIIYFGIIALSLAACGQQEKDKVTQLKEYKEELKELEEKIAALEADIDGGDSMLIKSAPENAVLVSALEVEKEEFHHMIEVRGTVESRRNVMISAEMPGKVENIHTREGAEVKKGQTLVSLDADVLRNQISTLKTQLELATTVYERQARLWEKNIGTEMQYLEAKNRKETLERQLSTSYSQLSQAIIKAPFNGIVDEIPAKEGEMMQPGMPLIRIVSPEQVYIEADVSERFIGRFETGDEVQIYLPSQDKELTSRISSVSRVINKENRTFSVEVQVPDVDFTIKPNQTAVLRLRDYKNQDAITVPTKIIQTDLEGSYVYTLEKEEDNFVSRKRHVNTGMTYASKTEITEGLAIGDLVIDKGISELSDGVHVRLADEKAVEAVRMASGN